MTQTRMLVQKTVHFLANGESGDQSLRFYREAFVVPEQCVRLVISLTPDSTHPVQLPMGLFDAQGHVRLLKAGARVTNQTMTFELTETDASSGGIPGRFPAGEWKLIVYKRRMIGNVPAELTIQCETGIPSQTPAVFAPVFAQACLEERKGWYQGELHTHSSESTGRTSVAEVVEAARECQLDFLGLTDHFTASHWCALESVFDGQKPLLLQSMEVSGDRGHANLHGLSQWLNPLVDDNDELVDFLGLRQKPSMNQLADAAHEQGGLMCINHALSGEMGWRYHEFDMHKADLIEVWCLSELDTTLTYPAYYDMLLARGYHLTAVGSSDSHHPTRPGPWKLGQVRTFIYADSLSQQDLLAGLKAGHAYISVDGCEMNLTAQCGSCQVMMGDTLTIMPGQEMQLTVDLQKHPKGNLFVYMNGSLLESRYVDHAAPATIVITVPDCQQAEQGYVRVEFYEVEGELPYYGYSWRNWQSLRLISNPIYFTKGV